MQTQYPNTVHTLPGPNSTALPGPGPGILGECIGTAEKLCEVLREEADALKRFASDDLLNILPGKQILVNELRDRLEELHSAGINKGAADSTAARLPLRSLLENIQEQNRFNETFVKNTLGYWQDLLSIFLRPAYGPGQESIARKRASITGRTFNREV